MSGDEVTTSGGTVTRDDMGDDVREWLDHRQPGAPTDLRRRIDDALGEPASPEGHAAAWRADALLEAGQERLETAVARPGRVRETAFELLVADALVTYACEAALEGEDPSVLLNRLVKVGRTR